MNRITVRIKTVYKQKLTVKHDGWYHLALIVKVNCILIFLINIFFLGTRLTTPNAKITDQTKIKAIFHTEAILLNIKTHFGFWLGTT